MDETIDLDTYTKLRVWIDGGHVFLRAEDRYDEGSAQVMMVAGQARRVIAMLTRAVAELQKE